MLRALAVTCVSMLPAAMQASDWQPLCSDAGVPSGWDVRAWDDVARAAPSDAVWQVDDDGVLHGSQPRGTWLVSEKEYADYELEFDFKLGPQGNSGVGLRFPKRGDPAFDGIELQMVDERYNDGRDGADKLTGSLYKALPPLKQVYKPTAWNHYRIVCRGNRIQVELNGEMIQDVNLDDERTAVERHDGQSAEPLAKRPRRGHIGFQELSRGDMHVQIRKARIREL